MSADIVYMLHRLILRRGLAQPACAEIGQAGSRSRRESRRRRTRLAAPLGARPKLLDDEWDVIQL
jgi:hypothetical protein